jgi:hypothetical protein
MHQFPCCTDKHAKVLFSVASSRKAYRSPRPSNFHPDGLLTQKIHAVACISVTGDVSPFFHSQRADETRFLNGNIGERQRVGDGVDAFCSDVTEAKSNASKRVSVPAQQILSARGS